MNLGKLLVKEAGLIQCDIPAKTNKYRKPYCRKLPYPTGTESLFAKHYLVTFPDGENEVVKGLAAFCRNHGLNHSAMFQVAKGRHAHHKNYKCEKLK